MQKNRVSLLLLAVAVLAVVPLGCGKPRDVGQTFHAANAANLACNITVKRADAKWFIAAISLENVGKQTIAFSRSPSDMTLEAGGQPPTVLDPSSGYNPWNQAGSINAMVAAANANQQATLGAGQRSVFEVKWRFPTKPLPSKNYAWKIRLSGISVDGKPIPDISVDRPAALN